jgi:hypothetical protein
MCFRDLATLWWVRMEAKASLCFVVFGSSMGIVVVVVDTEKGRAMFYKFWFLI